MLESIGCGGANGAGETYIRLWCSCLTGVKALGLHRDASTMVSGRSRVSSLVTSMATLIRD